MEHVAYKQLKDDIEQATQKGDWFNTMGLLMMQPVYGVYHDLTTKPFPRSLMSPATMKLASSGLVGTYMTTVVDQLVFAAGGSVDGAEERAEKFEDTLRKDLLKLVIYVLSFAFSFMLGLAVAAGAQMNYDAYTEQREKAQADADKAASAAKAAKQNDAPAPNLRDIDFDAIEKGQSALEELRAKAARESVLRQCPEAALAAEEAAAAASKARKAAEEAAAAAREVGKNAKEAKEAAGNEVRKASKKAAAEAAARLVEQKKGEADHYDSLAKEAKERVRDEMESYAEKARTVTKNQFSEVEKMLAEAKEIVRAVDDEVHEAGRSVPQKLESLQEDMDKAMKRIESIRSGAKGLNQQAEYMWKTLDATNVSAEKEFDFTKMNDLLKVRDSAKQMCKEAGIELRKMENATRDEVAAYELRKLERTALQTSVEAGRAADDADEAAKDAANYARASANART